MGKVQEHKRIAKVKKQVDITNQKVKKGNRFKIVGTVVKCLPNTMFHVKITESDLEQLVGKTLLATLAGKMRLYRIRVMEGDVVKGYVSKNDLTKCKITYRTI